MAVAEHGPFPFISQFASPVLRLHTRWTLRNTSSPMLLRAQETFPLPAVWPRGRCRCLALSRMPKVLYKGAKTSPAQDSRTIASAAIYTWIEPGHCLGDANGYFAALPAHCSVCAVMFDLNVVDGASILEYHQPCHDASLRLPCFRAPLEPKPASGGTLRAPVAAFGDCNKEQS